MPASLGIANLVGACLLGRLYKRAFRFGIQLSPSFLKAVHSAYPFLLGYAVLFNVIPLLRLGTLKIRNWGVERRNDTRGRWRRKLLSSSKEVCDKLRSADRFREAGRLVGGDDDTIVYDTSWNVDTV